MCRQYAEHGNKVYWTSNLPHGSVIDGVNFVYVFPPQWSFGWPGAGYWRLGHPNHTPVTVSKCCETPEELEALYVTLLLTGDWQAIVAE